MINKFRYVESDYDSRITFQCLKCMNKIHATESLRYDNWQFCPFCGTKWEGEHKWEKDRYYPQRDFINCYEIQYKRYIDWHWLDEIDGVPERDHLPPPTEWQNFGFYFDRKEVAEAAKDAFEHFKYGTFKGEVVEVRAVYVTKNKIVPTKISYYWRNESTRED